MSEKEIETCLVCGNEPFGRPLRRGLCTKHYEQYLRARKHVEAKDLDVEAWEDDLISRGQLASDGRASVNPFIEAMVRLESKNKGTTAWSESGISEEEKKANKAKSEQAVKKSRAQSRPKPTTKRKGDTA